MVISKDGKLTSARLSLLKATQITLKNTLDLLGVSAPEHM
jgi:arginyl-tRNA synthetase